VARRLKARRARPRTGRKPGRKTKGRMKKDILGQVMSKVAKGMKLTKRDRQIISAAVDASKKAASERSKKRG